MQAHMNKKSRDVSISERLDGISSERGFEAARKLVTDRNFGERQQKEANAWLRKELVKRNWWKTILGIASIVGAVAAVVPLFHK